MRKTVDFLISSLRRTVLGVFMSLRLTMNYNVPAKDRTRMLLHLFWAEWQTSLETSVKSLLVFPVNERTSREVCHSALFSREARNNL